MISQTNPVPRQITLRRERSAVRRVAAGKPAHSLGVHWNLKELDDPLHWQTFETTENLFAGSYTLRIAYDAVVKLNPESARTLRRFAARDRRLNDSKPWQETIAKRLLTIGACSRRMADRLFHIGRTIDSNGNSVPFPAWMLRNCPPAGAKWTPKKLFKDPTGRNPTGRACHEIACVWCWWRLNRFLSKLLRLSPQFLIQPPRCGSPRKPGLGWASGVNVWAYDLFAPNLFENEGAEITAFRIRMDEKFRHSRGRPTQTLKLLAPVFERGKFGVRISYLYSPEFSVDDQIATNIGPEEALQTCAPYCIPLLESDTNPQQIVDVLDGLYRKHSYQVVNLRPEPKQITVKIAAEVTHV